MAKAQDLRQERKNLISGSSYYHGADTHLPILALPSVTAAVSIRQGGVSHPPYDKLNLAYHVGDADEKVAENRRRFCSSLNIDPDSLVIAQQVHGHRIALIDDSQVGRGAHGQDDAIPNTDAMITQSRSAILGVLTADCVPVLISDPVSKAIGIAHAGWRGTLQRIASRTIIKMCDTFGTRPADCHVALGPSIGPCCYTVGTDVADQFQGEFDSANCVIGNKLDLQRAIRSQLTEIGVEDRYISSAELCTACNLALLYSYRAEGGRTGRMMSVIKLAYD